MTHVFNDSMPLALLHYMGLAKRKGVFEHAQNTQIQIHPTLAYKKSQPGICSPMIHYIVFNNSLADSKGHDQHPRRLI